LAAAAAAAGVVVVVLVAGVGSCSCCWCRRGGPCRRRWQQQMLLVSSSWSLLPALAAAGAAGIVVLVLVAGGVVDGVVDDSPWEIDHHVSMSHGMFRYRLMASQISSPSRGPSEPFLTASHGSGYHSSAWLGLRLQAEPFTSLFTGILGCRQTKWRVTHGTGKY